MTNLTEQWKAGELPSGWYYVKGNRAEGIYAYTAEYLNNMYRPRNGEKIIEQVPSYEEWQDQVNATRFYADKFFASCDENTKLKGLLKLNNVLNKGSKSIYAWLKEDTAGEQKKLCADMFDKTVEMMSEINQVLGEE